MARRRAWPCAFPDTGCRQARPVCRLATSYVIVRTADDPSFERRGSDLSRLETVEVYDAALGTSLNVPTLDGEATVKVAPGTQPDTVLRLRGKGLPRLGGGSRGDLFIRLQVHVPERLSDR
jgi:molecular chaperone DnaJ